MTNRSSPPSIPDRPMRRVLMVLYLFPPLGGVGMSRNLRNTRYLPDHGWAPIVVTPANGAYAIKDPGTVTLIDDRTTVIRTGAVEAGHIRAWLGSVRGRLGGRRDSPTADPHAANPAIVPAPTPGPAASEPTVRQAGDGAAAQSSGPGRPMALVRRLRHAVFFPDDQVGWAPFAVRAALRAHRAAPMDAIFSTSSPVTAHLIGGLVHRATGLPWVVEFRDPWVGNVIEGRQPWMVDRLRRRLERWIVRNAAEVVCVTPTLARIYQERYPAARVTLVPNGYDRAERADRSPDAGGDGRYRLVFTGTLDRPHELETFLVGIERLVDRRPEIADRLRVTFYGLVSQECRVLADRMFAGGPLATIATFAGFVPRAEAVRAVADADAALVLLGEGPGMELFIGGKLYDYLGQDRQIFAMVPRGDAREVLAGLDWGIVADPDPASVELALERLIETPRPDRPADPEGRYDRAVLAGRLAAVLDRSVEARGSGSTMDDAR